MIITELQASFTTKADVEKKIQMQAYMKNKFVYFGVPSPIRKDISKPFLNSTKPFEISEILSLSKTLWNLPERELHYFAMDLLSKHKRKLKENHLKQGEYFILTNSWWDTVDLLATHYFGSILCNLPFDKQKKYTEYLSGHENMWMNRVGMIFQLKMKENTRTELLEIAILPHLDSKEFFHQKAIGWALRQYSKFNPTYVQMFLEQYELAPLSVREASKYL